MKAGPRRDKIVFQRFDTVENGFGEPVDAAMPTPIGEAMAQVVYGRGSERREAAREGATLPATFRVRANTMTCSVGTDAQLLFDGAVWDITSNVALGRDGREITAVRQA